MGSACDCCQVPFSRIALVYTTAAQVCSNSCGDRSNIDDPCGIYLKKITTSAGNQTGRILTNTFSPTGNSCETTCPPADESCEGGYEITTTIVDNYVYPCGSATETTVGVEVIGWVGDCFNNTYERTGQITGCEGEISVVVPSGETETATLTGRATIIGGVCFIEITSSEGGEPYYTLPQSIGFGNDDFGGLCAGQDLTRDTTVSRLPEILENEEYTYEDKNTGCEGWCGDGLGEIEPIQEVNEWGDSSFEIYGGSSAYGNEKHRGQAKYQIAFYPTATCYLKVWIQTKKTLFGPSSENIYDCGPFYSDETGVTKSVTEYEWGGSAVYQNLCFEPPYTDENLTPDQIIYSGVYFSNSEPADGTSEIVEIRILKYSFLEGYTPNDPDENGSQGCFGNGYPTAPCND